MLSIDSTLPPLYKTPTPVTRRTTGKYSPHIFLKDINHISAFAHNNAAIDRSGNLWTWGCDTMARRDGIASYDFPPPFNNSPSIRLEHVVDVSAGGESTFCVTSDGLLWGWGPNRQGKLGIGDDAPRLEPTIILDGVKSVFSGADTTFCIREDDSLWGWGWSSEGCPIPSGQEVVLKPIHIMDDVIQASCNDDTAMVIKKDRSLWGWGDYITDKRITTPAPLMDDMGWVSVPGHGCGFALAVTCAGDLYSFGISTYGSMTTWQKRMDDSTPIKVLSGVDKVWAGHETSFIRLKNGDLLSSGNNGGGQCGIGRCSAPFHKPAYVMPDVKEAAVGWHHAMSLQENGDLWIFGGQYSEKP